MGVYLLQQQFIPTVKSMLVDSILPHTLPTLGISSGARAKQSRLQIKYSLGISSQLEVQPRYFPSAHILHWATGPLPSYIWPKGRGQGDARSSPNVTPGSQPAARANAEGQGHGHRFAFSLFASEEVDTYEAFFSF